MFFKRIISKWLAHYSYMIADGNQGVVIDPRRDYEVYLKNAAREGFQITHILETHRNEDYVAGSAELARRTGAAVLRSAYSPLEFHYGQTVQEGDLIQFGRLKIQVLHTPGHTLGHLGFLLFDPSGAPWIFFSGDALFAGDVGRTDFYGQEKLEEMTALLYDSIFKKILPLGDEVILCPAHGAGSVCGSSIAERSPSTLGLERKHNPKLRFTDKETFIKQNGQMLERAPYFREVERLNLLGHELPENYLNLPPLSPREFAEQSKNAQIIDLRDEMAFTAGFVKNSLFYWQKLISFYAGWFLDFNRPIYFISDGEPIEPAIRQLLRLGYDKFGGYLSGGIKTWLSSGQPLEQLESITPQSFLELISSGFSPLVLDIRSEKDYQTNPFQMEGIRTINIPLTEFEIRGSDFPQSEPFYILCNSGTRSTLAASLLKSNEVQNGVVLMGGTSSLNLLS